jgi:hypothetical protein
MQHVHYIIGLILHFHSIHACSVLEFQMRSKALRAQITHLSHVLCHGTTALPLPRGSDQSLDYYY